MNILLPLIYFTFFAVIAGGAFALMWGNVKLINEEMKKPQRTQHPEAPEPGEEVLYVNLDKERLEDIFNK